MSHHANSSSVAGGAPDVTPATVSSNLNGHEAQGSTVVALYLLRGAFILLAAVVTSLYVLPFQQDHRLEFGQVALMILLTVGVAMAVIFADIFSGNKHLSALSGVFLGLLGGLLGAYALSFVVDLVGVLSLPSLNFEPPQTQEGFEALTEQQRSMLRERESYLKLLEGVKVFIGLITCYISISLVMQTKDDFRFVIPYVEFSKQLRGLRPTLLDSSIIIDGRIVDIIHTRICQGPLVVPRFVLQELHALADSSDKLKRARGRRGLEVLQQLQRNPVVEVHLDDNEAEGVGVDQQLVSLAQAQRARLMTNDFNLSKIAQLRDIPVINLNDLSKALRPVKLPGESIQIRVIKPGETASQGVGYLEDGTMVVVENARQLIDQEIEATVTSTLQTSAGRMIFARYGEPASADHARVEKPDRQQREPKSDDHNRPASPANSKSVDGTPPDPDVGKQQDASEPDSSDHAATGKSGGRSGRRRR